MDVLIDESQLEQLFDRALREVSLRSGGVVLRREKAVHDEELCTVYIAFNRGFHFGLTLCADAALLVRMARHVLRTELISDRVLEDFSKEYFNVLCGRISALLYKTTRVACRFTVPAFYRGRYEPGQSRRQLVLDYISDRQESLRLVHHIPMEISSA